MSSVFSIGRTALVACVIFSGCSNPFAAKTGTMTGTEDVPGPDASWSGSEVAFSGGQPHASGTTDGSGTAHLPDGSASGSATPEPPVLTGATDGSGTLSHTGSTPFGTGGDEEDVKEAMAEIDRLFDDIAKTPEKQ